MLCFLGDFFLLFLDEDLEMITGFPYEEEDYM